jgi:orotate phosphoribosyltransferase
MSILQTLKDEDILKKGDFLLRSGERSPYYCDIKKALGNPILLALLVDSLSGKVPEDTTCIAGSGYGGIALATGVALKLKKPLTLVRDAVKDHGTKVGVEGYVPQKEDKVCIIDDVLTTGGSIKDLIKKLEPTGVSLAGAIVVVARAEPVLPLRVASLVSASDLLNI